VNTLIRGRHGSWKSWPVLFLAILLPLGCGESGESPSEAPGEKPKPAPPILTRIQTERLAEVIVKLPADACGAPDEKYVIHLGRSSVERNAPELLASVKANFEKTNKVVVWPTDPPENSGVFTYDFAVKVLAVGSVRIDYNDQFWHSGYDGYGSRTSLVFVYAWREGSWTQSERGECITSDGSMTPRKKR
jgi:hypothetical protein